MIIFEDELAKLVGILPKAVVNETELQINFGWGTESVLAKYLTLKGKLSFPLIWLVEGEDENNLFEPSVKRSNAKIYVLYESQAPDQFNDYQHEWDFSIVLQPILDNLLIALENSYISMYEPTSFRTQRIKNFSMREIDKSLVYVCNAIVLNADITFFGNKCLNNFIQFNN